ncbi:hypothetical protein MNB_SV-13-1267 [hydrothermal vent metagenome]|uniref:Bacteriophage T5 Orf172 DNA-binding domain-containing protein n=1 Tax=hydrothermal vent metagenome TaxID=652676 RepID=A0A1W1D0M4_9ZZZZ
MKNQLYVYIFYSSKLKAYKIGESIDVERRLKEVRRGSAGGDSTTVYIDSFKIDEKLLIHRAKRGVDLIFHHFGGYTERIKNTESDNWFYTEWFKITEKEAREAITKGFDKLKKDSELYQKKKLCAKVNRRFNLYINRRNKKSSFLNKVVFLNKCLDRCEVLGIDIDIEIKENTLNNIFSVQKTIFIRNVSLFEKLLTKDEMYKGVLIASDRYNYSFKRYHYYHYSSKDKIDIALYHNFIMENKEDIINRIKSIRLINDRYSTREAILTLSSRLKWEAEQFAQAVRENYHLLSLEHYYSYNLNKHDDEFYFLSLRKRFDKFDIKVDT